VMRVMVTGSPGASSCVSIHAATRASSTSGSAIFAVCRARTTPVIHTERRLRRLVDLQLDREPIGKGENIVSFVRLLPAWLHAIADYAVGLSLIVVAVAVGGSGKAVATGVVVGAVVLIVSMLTKYPLGVAKVLPFTVHSAGDYLAAALLIVSPFALNFNDSDSGLTAFYIVAGIAVLAVSLITNYQYSDKREWSPTRAVTA
jgi:hypothetical protein